MSNCTWILYLLHGSTASLASLSSKQATFSCKEGKLFHILQNLYNIYQELSKQGHADHYVPALEALLE